MGEYFLFCRKGYEDRPHWLSDDFRYFLQRNFFRQGSQRWPLFTLPFWPVRPAPRGHQRRNEAGLLVLVKQVEQRPGLAVVIVALAVVVPGRIPAVLQRRLSEFRALHRAFEGIRLVAGIRVRIDNWKLLPIFKKEDPLFSGHFGQSQATGGCYASTGTPFQVALRKTAVCLKIDLEIKMWSRESLKEVRKKE